MKAPLQHPIWAGDEIVIHSCRLIDQTGTPGSIILEWQGPAGKDYYVMIGNSADDFLEHYRAAPDDEARDLIMQYEIRKVAAR